MTRQDDRLGAIVPDWQGLEPPRKDSVNGRYCSLIPTTRDDAPALFEAYTVEGGDAGWDYLGYGPFNTQADFTAWLVATCLGGEPLFFTVRDCAGGRALGLLSYLRIRPAVGSVETGHVHFSPALKRTPMATEALFLAMAHVMNAGYRRLEWKCNALNAASRRAAERLGFQFEGVFRQDMVVKGRNRDTAWFSMMDYEWPKARRTIADWLSPDNFDGKGQQKMRLDVKMQ